MAIEGESAVQEAKDPKSTETGGGESGTERKEPDSAATSDDTLSDIEETEKVSNTPGKESGGQSSSTPSPDGAFDEGGSRGPSEDPGPM
jgi:hypothetical protein